MCNPRLECKTCGLEARLKTDLLAMTAHGIETGHNVESIRFCPQCKAKILVTDHVVSYKHSCGTIFEIKKDLKTGLGIIVVLGRRLSRKQRSRQRKLLGEIDTPSSI